MFFKNWCILHLRNLSMHTFHKCAFHESCGYWCKSCDHWGEGGGIRTGNYAWPASYFIYTATLKQKATTTTTETHTHTHRKQLLRTEHNRVCACACVRACVSLGKKGPEPLLRVWKNLSLLRPGSYLADKETEAESLLTCPMLHAKLYTELSWTWQLNFFL